MLKKELNEAIAKAETDEVPSVEEFALQDLIPGQEKVAKAGSIDPNDPLNLNALLPPSTNVSAVMV